MPENVITRWECPYEDCATPFGASCAANLHASGECVAAERTYVAADALREWIEGEWDGGRWRDEASPVVARSTDALLERLSALLDELETGGKTDG